MADNTAPQAAQAQQAVEEAGRLRLAVMRLSRRLRQQHPTGITQSQISALSVIAGVGPLTIGELAAYEGVQSPTMSRIVDALEAGGWVERIADEHDRRVARVRVTESAAREMERIRAERDAYLAERIATLTAHEQAAITGAIPALERLLETP